MRMRMGVDFFQALPRGNEDVDSRWCVAVAVAVVVVGAFDANKQSECDRRSVGADVREGCARSGRPGCHRK